MFLFVFVACLLAVLGISVTALKNRLADEVSIHTREFSASHDHLTHAFGALEKAPVDAPCSDAFLHWMRQVAFFPDGIHEFMYAEGNRIMCTTTRGRLATPVNLGERDAVSTSEGLDIWFNRSLSPFGFPDMTGTFIRRDNFVLVAPEPDTGHDGSAWHEHEIVFASSDGSLWHRNGLKGLFSDQVAPVSAREIAPKSMLTERGCDLTGTTCIAVAVPFNWLVSPNNPLTYLGLVATAIIAAGVVAAINRYLARLWSFPVRFQRRLSEETIVCHYQPLLSIGDDRISGVEVLARWRDADGNLVGPDRFLPIVESRRLQDVFTAHVVNRAYQELSQLPAGPQPLHVHFNIFPSAFSTEKMLALLEDFLADRTRFTVVIELIESDALPMEATHQTIQQLEEAGILTYIDDFGEGFSSIQYLAGLATHGVKLDKSFGLAPRGSLMEAMLASAIEMVGKTGQTLVVEGVETLDRLETLKASKKVALVQGYYISRPLDLENFRAFLEHYPDKRAAA